MLRNLMTLAFPAQPRSFPWQRTIKTTLRTLHIFSAGTLLAGHWFGLSTEELLPWLRWAIVSGGLLFAVDLYASCAVLCELRGLAVLLKLVLLLLVQVWWDLRVPLLLSALVIGSVVSHMPGRFRHINLCPGRRSPANHSRG